MASGITTNTTQADIDIKVVVPELNAGLNVPGVTPNGELSLISNDSSSGLITSVTNPELVASSNTLELTTTENIVTTNITLSKPDIDIKVVVPELNAGFNAPGVAPNGELSLISNDSSSGLITSVTNPELVAGSNALELTTTEDIFATNITLGKFVRGLESLNLKNPIYNKLGKVLTDTSIFADFFNRRVQYIREITDPVKSTTLDVRLFVNKSTIDKTALQDLLNTFINLGKNFIDHSNFIDTKFNYSLSTSYTDIITLSESTKLALRFIRNIVGQEVLVASHLKVVITPYKQVNESLVLQDTYNRIWYINKALLDTGILNNTIIKLGIVKFLDNEYFNIHDLSSINYLKNINNITNTINIDPKFIARKSILETSTTISEALVKTTKVNLIETRYISDTYYKYSMLKLLTDSFNNTLKIAITPYKQVNESLVLQDTYNRILYINKVLLDTGILNNTIIKLGIVKFLDNEYFSIHDLSSINYLKNINNITNTINIDPKFIASKSILETSTIYTQNYYFNTDIKLNTQLLTNNDSRIQLLNFKEFYNSITSSDSFSKIVEYNSLFIDIKTTIDSKISRFKKSILDFTNKSLDTTVKHTFNKKYNDLLFVSETLTTRSNVFRDFTDTVNTVEELSNAAKLNGVVFIGFYKGVIEKVNVQLNTIRFNYSRKIPNDILNITNPTSISFSTTFNNVLNTTDTSRFKFNYLKNVQQDTNTIYDLFEYIATFNIFATDTNTIYDLFEYIATFNIFATDATQNLNDTYYSFNILKNIYNIAQTNTIPSIYFSTQLTSNNNSFNTAHIYLTFNTTFNDSNSYITETFTTRSNVFRNFTDTIDTIEELNNAAKLKGVVFVGFYKGVTEKVNVQLNTIKFNYYKPQKDILDISSNYYIRTNKNNIESILNKERIVKNISKKLTDITLFNATTIKKYFNKIFSDAKKIIDRFTLRYTHKLFNIVTITDSLTSSLTYDRQFKNKFKFTDSLTNSLTYRRQFNDIVSNIDITIINSSIAKTIGYGISNITSIVESGNINSQNYFAETYIESGYIGRVQYFNTPSYWTEYLIASDFKNIDLLALSNTKRFNNIIRKVESGNINNQNYFAEIYIEPGYIGRVQYFNTPSYWTDYAITSDFKNIDLLALSNTKQFSDLVTKIDVNSLKYTKQFNNIINFTDSLTSDFTYGKQFNHTINFTDSLTSSATYRRQFNHTINSTDSLTSSATYRRQFNHTINSTDSLTSSATYRRQFNHTINSTDSLTSSATYRRQFNHTINFTDNLTSNSNYRRQFNDIINSTDNLTSSLTYRRQFSDIVTNIDTTIIDVGISKRIEYGINNIISTVESGNINSQNYFSEIYIEPGYIGTITYINIFSNRVDYLIASDFKNIDLLALSNTKQFSDIINFTDSLTTSATYRRQLNDIINSTDSLTTTISTAMAYNISDITSTVESGNINNQNYFSEIYIEPGYIGRIQYFNTPSYWTEYLIASDFKNIDLLALSNTKRFNNITSTVESGNINSQNYFSEIYIESGYIGRIQYFNTPSYWIDYVTANDFKNIDLLALSNTKQFNDILNSTDSLTSSLTYRRQFNDTINFTDSLTTSIIKGGLAYSISDTTNILESVTINIQDYFGENYLDAGYIGSNTYIYSKAIVRTTTDITKLNDSGIINKQNYAISNYAVPGYAGINIVY